MPYHGSSESSIRLTNFTEPFQEFVMLFGSPPAPITDRVRTEMGELGHCMLFANSTHIYGQGFIWQFGFGGEACRNMMHPWGKHNEFPVGRGVPLEALYTKLDGCDMFLMRV